MGRRRSSLAGSDGDTDSLGGSLTSPGSRHSGGGGKGKGRRSASQGGDPDFDDDADLLEVDPFDAAVEQLYEKRASTREAALSSLVSLLAQYRYDDCAFREDTLTQLFLSSVRRGKEVEACMAAKALGLHVVTLGASSASEGIYREAERVLEPLVLTGKSTPVRVAGVEALSVLCFVGSEGAVETLHTMSTLWRVVLTGWKRAAVAPAVVAALRGWAFLLSTVHPAQLDSHFVETHLGLLAQLLNGSDVEVRGAAGEAIALLWDMADLSSLPESPRVDPRRGNGASQFNTLAAMAVGSPPKRAPVAAAAAAPAEGEAAAGPEAAVKEEAGPAAAAENGSSGVAPAAAEAEQAEARGAGEAPAAAAAPSAAVEAGEQAGSPAAAAGAEAQPPAAEVQTAAAAAPARATGRPPLPPGRPPARQSRGGGGGGAQGPGSSGPGSSGPGSVDGEEEDEEAVDSLEAIVERMRDLAKNRGDASRLSKGERASSRGTFRDLLAIIQGEYVPETKIKLRHGDVLMVTGLLDNMRLNYLRGYLADAFQAHLQGNELLHEVFRFAPADEPEERLTPLEKRLFRSKSSSDVRDRTEARRKERATMAHYKHGNLADLG